jgi:tRNA uridine 5-carboxymethylaminomethyl modification enzyme
MKYGFKFGLIPKEMIRRLTEKEKFIGTVLNDLKRIKPSPDTVNPILKRFSTAPIDSRQSLYRLLKRPQVRLEDFADVKEVAEMFKYLGEIRGEVVEQVEIEIKYQGYFERQKNQVQRVKRLEKKRIPDSIDYHGITALSKEAREKLDRIRPVSMGHAARVSGVSQADISILSLFIEKGISSRSVPRGTD